MTALLPSILLRRYGSHHAFLAAHYLSVYARDHSDNRRARRYSQIALKAAEESGDAYYEAIAYDEAASTAALGGAYAEACRLSENACAVLETYGGPEPPEQVRGMIVHNLGYALLAQRNYEAALVALRTGVEIMKANGCEWCLENAEINIAVACLGLDRLDDAEREVERAASRLDPGDRQFRYVHYLRGEIAHRRGSFDAARAHFTQLQAFYPQFQSLPDLLLSIDLLPLLLPE